MQRRQIPWQAKHVLWLVASCWRKWLGECRCGAQGRASKSVCLARTHTRTCLGSDFIQFDFLSVRVCVSLLVCVFVCVQRMHLISMLDVALPSSLA